MSAAVASSSRASMAAPPAGGAVTLETLRQRLAKGKATRASLQADLARLEALSALDSPASGAAAALSSLAMELAESEDRALLYRTTGITVFECDLDVGRRERTERRREAAHRSDALGLGVRLETFCRGRFHEPYYLVFARPSQILVDQARIVHSALDRHRGGDAAGSSKGAAADVASSESEAQEDPLILIRHTVPSHVPLQRLIARYLRRQGSSIAPASSAQHEEATAKVLELTGQPNLWLFLSHLHTHLQAFVSRRQQASSLSSLPLNASMLEEVQPDGSNRRLLQAFADVNFTRHSIQWTLPSSVLSTSSSRRPKSRKAQEKLDSRVLLIQVTFGDLEADRLGPIKREQLVKGQSTHSKGSVSVHLLSSPSPGALARKRRRRTQDGEAEEEGEAEAEGEKTIRQRRRDLEALYEKESPLDDFVRRVVERCAEV